MKRNKQASIRMWTLAAAVGVLSAVVMITGAAQEKPRETAGESERPEVMPLTQEIVEVVPEIDPIEEIPAEVCAKMLGLRPSSFRSRLCRGKAELKSILKGEGIDV